MSTQPLKLPSRNMPFGMDGPLDQSRLNEFLRAVGQIDVPLTSAAGLDAATGVRREGRESR